MSRKAQRRPERTPNLLPDRRRAFWLKQTLLIALFGGLALSWRLWIATRGFPCCPVFSWLPAIPYPLDYAWFAVLLLLLAGALVLPQPRWCLILFAVLAGLLGLWDQNRWQPWFYQYTLMLLALACFPWRNADAPPERTEAVLDACRIVIACTYFWSGLHKMNWSFVDQLYPWLIGPWLSWFPEGLRPAMRASGYLAPVAEMAIGLGLLGRRFRNAAVAGSWIMHVFLLLCLGPLGLSYNSVVWPWNVAMMAFTGILFWRTGERPALSILRPGRRVAPAVALVLVGILPLLRGPRWLDAYFAAELYSGRTTFGVLYLRSPLHEQLPAEARPHVRHVDGDLYCVDLVEWALDELNAPPNPEARVYRVLARPFGSRAEHPSDAILEIVEPPRRRDGPSRVSRFDGAHLNGSD